MQCHFQLTHLNWSINNIKVYILYFKLLSILLQLSLHICEHCSLNLGELFTYLLSIECEILTEFPLGGIFWLRKGSRKKKMSRAFLLPLPHPKSADYLGTHAASTNMNIIQWCLKKCLTNTHIPLLNDVGILSFPVFRLPVVILGKARGLVPTTRGLWGDFVWKSLENLTRGVPRTLVEERNLMVSFAWAVVFFYHFLAIYRRFEQNL